MHTPVYDKSPKSTRFDTFPHTCYCYCFMSLI